MQLLNSLSISTLLVLGALANPLSSVNSDVYDISESTRLQTRTTQEQQNYQVLKAAAGHHKLDTGKQYAFVLKWALKHSDGLDDLNRLTSEIGGFHVGLIVGTIKGKDSFDGEYYDILFPKGFKVTQQNMNTAPVERWQHELKLSSRSTKTVIYRGPIPKVNEDHILDLGDAIVARHSGKYNLRTFNCQTFVDELYAALSKNDKGTQSKSKSHRVKGHK